MSRELAQRLSAGVCCPDGGGKGAERRTCAGRQQPTNYTVGIDLGQKQWNLKELARMDLRRAQVATGANDGLQIPYRPLTGGNTFGIPYAYQWVYTQPSRVEDRALVI